MLNNLNKNKTGAKLIVQTLTIILFIAVCTYFFMKQIDNDSDSLSTFFIGFGISAATIVLIAVYIKYVFDLYKEIKNTKSNHKLIEVTTLENEKLHMKDIHNKNIEKLKQIKTRKK